jgi:hypothetical protein
LDIELKEKLDLIDQQIDEQKSLYELIAEQESNSKSDWSNQTLHREIEIFSRIDKLQQTKTRLITGEKPPEIVYVDKEVPTIVKQEVIKVVEKPITKYIDRHTKYTHVYKPGLTVSALWFLLFVHGAAWTAWYYGYIDVIIRTKF